MASTETLVLRLCQLSDKEMHQKQTQNRKKNTSILGITNYAGKSNANNIDCV